MFQAGRQGAGCLNEKWLVLVYLCVLLSLLNPRSCPGWQAGLAAPSQPSPCREVDVGLGSGG